MGQTALAVVAVAVATSVTTAAPAIAVGLPEDTQAGHLDVAEEWLPADDECLEVAAPGQEAQCALNALQRRGLRVTPTREAGAEALAQDSASGRAEVRDPVDEVPDEVAVDPPPFPAYGLNATEPVPPNESLNGTLHASSSQLPWWPDWPYPWAPPGWVGGNCARYGCVAFTRTHSCQCNAECGRYGSCCADYAQRCLHHPAPAPPPAPHPPAPSCTASWSHNCMRNTRCCDPAFTCYEKNSGWAACLSSCAPGIHYSEPAQHRSPWSCRVLGGGGGPAPAPPPAPAPTPPASCTASYSHNCGTTRRCCDARMTCYAKDARWAGCLPSCSPGIHGNDPPSARTPWSCQVLTPGGPAPAPVPVPTPPPPASCTASWSQNCQTTRRCCDSGMTCYAKNSGWAACLSTCAPGIHWAEPAKYRTPWSCQVLSDTTTATTTTTTTTTTVATTTATTSAATESTTQTAAPITSDTTSSGGADSTSFTTTTTSSTLSYYQLHNPMFAQPSTAPLYTFYMYRVQNDEDYRPENQNLANAAGTLWYLHNEIVWHIPRRFQKTRIERYRVQTRAPQPLFDRGMNFGVRVAFDSGRCTGPYWSGHHSCNEDWDHYGYNVGCNSVGSFPTSQWRNQVHYRDAIWYSLPGECSNVLYWQHNGECSWTMPGGACQDGVTPTGQGDCTYSYTKVGEVSINELDGIGNYDAFVAAGGKEYDKHTDRGVHNSFWDFKFNDTACALRVQAMQNLFKLKSPDEPTDEEVPAPPCDFSYGAYYGR